MAPLQALVQGANFSKVDAGRWQTMHFVSTSLGALGSRRLFSQPCLMQQLFVQCTSHLFGMKSRLQ